MIVAVRHGPVAAAGICYGRWNPPLMNPPQTDADTILEALAGLPTGAALAPTAAGDILRIVSSPAERCRRIAAPLAARLGLAHDEDPRIAELSMGDWEGKPWQWIEQHDGERLQRWMEQWQTTAPPGGESLADLEARVRAAGDATGGLGRTLWITHAGVIRTLRVLLCGSTWPAAMQSKVPHLAPEPFLVGG
jgi:alpha-ribazole phosphatase